MSPAAATRPGSAGWCASRGCHRTAERPYGGYFDEIVDALLRGLPGGRGRDPKVVVDRGELTLHIDRAST